MTDARYTLEMGGKIHGFTLADADFSAPRDSIGYGLGETVVDSMEIAGHDTARVAVVREDIRKRVGFTVNLHRDSARTPQVLAVGRKLADITYNALEGAYA